MAKSTEQPDIIYYETGKTSVHVSGRFKSHFSVQLTVWSALFHTSGVRDSYEYYISCHLYRGRTLLDQSKATPQQIIMNNNNKIIKVMDLLKITKHHHNYTFVLISTTISSNILFNHIFEHVHGV